MKTLLLDNGTIQLYAWAETRALQGQCQMEVKLHECHSKKEKKQLKHLEMTVLAELTIKFTNSLHAHLWSRKQRSSPQKDSCSKEHTLHD